MVRDLASQLALHIEEKAPPLTAPQFESRYVGPNAPMRLLLALKESRVVGMISWMMTHELYSAESLVYISDLAVHREARGQGVGTALMSHVKAWAHAHRAQKLGWMVWHRNDSAKAFYEKLGATADPNAIPYGLTL